MGIPWTEIPLHFSFPVREKHLQLAPAQLRNSLQTAGYHVSGPGETRHLSTAFLCWDSSRSGVHKGSEDRPLHGWQMHPSDHIWTCQYQGPGTRAFCWTTSIVSALPGNVCSLEWTGLSWAQFWGSELKLKVLVGLVSPKTPFLTRVFSPSILGPGNYFHISILPSICLKWKFKHDTYPED